MTINLNRSRLFIIILLGILAAYLGYMYGQASAYRDIEKILMMKSASESVWMVQ